MEVNEWEIRINHLCKASILVDFSIIILDYQSMQRYKQEQIMNRALNFLLGATIGGLIGAILAILLTPYSGEELRTEINIRADRVRTEVSQAAADRRAELERQLAALKAPQQTDQ